MIRILVKASSAIAKAGLESLLRAYPGFELLREPTRGAESTHAVLESPTDVLVAEAESLADPSARDAVEWARMGGSVVLLIRNPASEAIAEALRAGVKALLPNHLPSSELVKAIDAAAAGLVVLDEAGVGALLRAPSTVAMNGAEGLSEPLTPRETEVLRLLAAGLGNKEIASRLEISEHTVKFHVASVMGKLGAGSRTEAVTLGIRHGLVMI